MGYDIYGISPQLNKDYPKKYYELMKKYGKDGFLDWNRKGGIPDKVKDKYFAYKDKFEEDNPGSYFRNNVWFWRPLWNFVCQVSHDVLTEEDMAGGDSNSGYQISERKAIDIATKLCKALADGTVDEVERTHELHRLQAEAHNKEVRKELNKITEACQKEHGKDIVPRDYPEPYNTQWNECYAKEKFSANYPFSRDNVENFAKFCMDSGGFEIC